MEAAWHRAEVMCASAPRFDLQLAQALGESAFERSLREKVTQENSSLRWEMGKLQQSLEVSGGWPTCSASQSRSSSQSKAILFAITAEAKPAT